MNKQKIIAAFVRMFPAASGVRKKYNEKRYLLYKSKYMDPAAAERAKNDLTLKKQAVEEFKAKYPQNAKKAEALMMRQLGRAPEYKDRQNDTDLHTDIMFCKYAYGFEPDEYICYEMEHKNAEERLSFVSDTDLMCYIYRMNDRIDFSIYNDKAKTYLFFNKYYGRQAVVIQNAADYDSFLQFVKAHPVFVKKNVYEAMGRSVELIDIRTCGKSEKELFDELISQGKTLIEERIIQSDAMAAFNKSSVNTIRCITFKTKDGIIVPYCFMKSGRSGSFIDNGGAGGILTGIDEKTGVLNSDGYDEFNTRYPAHPDSDVEFMGYQLPDFEQAIELAKELSALTPTVRFVGWDFAHTDKGWVVIEGNGMSQLIGPQIVRRHGVKAEVEEIMSNMDLII